MDTSSNKNKHERKKRRKTFRLYNKKWVILITIWTFILAIGMSFVSESILRNVDIFIAFLILIVIVFFGVFSDLIGIAVASASETPFHAMASNRIPSARFCVKLVRNAGPVANFCNDVVGDICGIVSGAAGAIIILQLSKIVDVNVPLLSILISGMVASMTVGGKAIAKEIALRNSTEIVFHAGQVLYSIFLKTGLDFLPEKRKKD